MVESIDPAEMADLEAQCRQVRQEYLVDEGTLQMKEELEHDRMKRKIRIPRYYPEPQVTSQNKEERKLARKLRILRRKQYMSTKDEPPKDVKEGDVVEMQLRKADEKLFFIEKEILKPIENIKLASEIRESRREKEEGTSGRRRRGELDEVAQESLSRYKELCDGWQKILAENDNPLDLRNSLLEHNQKCQEFLDQKDGIIRQLQIELKVTNEKIDKDERISRNDITAIGDKAMSQIKTMSRAYEHHLDLIQLVSDANTRNEIHTYQQKVEAFRRLRNLKQLRYEKKITDMKINNEQEMEDQRRELKEELNRMRNELERDQLDMEFVYSDVLGQCVVNAAKIFYNVEVLKGRVMENEYLITHQTHRLRSVSTEARYLQKEIHRLEKEMQSETERVHAEARMLYRRIMDNQQRSLISTAANDKQYRDMWRLNRTNIMNMANRVLQTDRVIHEQFLGLDWTPALNLSTEVDEFNIMPSYSESFKIFNTPLYEENPSSGRSDSDATLEEPRGKRQVPLFIRTWETCEPSSTSVGQEQQISPSQSKEQIQQEFLTTLMHYISDVSAFVVGNHLLDLIQSYDLPSKDVVKLDALFRALGAEKEELLPLLQQCFLPYAVCQICRRRRSNIENLRQESAAYPVTEDEEEDEEDEEDEKEDTEEMPSDANENLAQQKEPKHEAAVCESESKDVRFQLGKLPKTKAVYSVRKTSTDPMRSCIAPNKHPQSIKHMYVPLALNDFATAYTRLQTVIIIPLEERLAQPGRTLSRALVSKEVATFWDQWCSVLPEAREKIWDAFFIGLKRYYQLLKDRSQLNKKLNILRTQNEDFKHLLQNYLKGNKRVKIQKPLQKDYYKITEDDLLPKSHRPAIRFTPMKLSVSESPKVTPVQNGETAREPSNHPSKTETDLK